MAKLAAYAQYQASQQNQSKSKAGKITHCINGDDLCYHLLALTFVWYLEVVPTESFDWGRYICSNNTTGAPVSCFKHVSQSVVVLVLTPDLSPFSEVILPSPLGFLGPYGEMLGRHWRGSKGGSGQLRHQPLYQSVLDRRNH